jgi:hypothetical protein
MTQRKAATQDTPQSGTPKGNDMEEIQAKLCINCVNYRKGPTAGSEPVCTFNQYGISLVDGKPIFNACVGERVSATKCGAAAKNFNCKSDYPF